MSLLASWKNVSIAKKLYFVVGIMAFLIAGELVTLRFAMKNLSAARAFVGAEALWSKAQKDAAFSLQRFGITKNEKDFETYLADLEIPQGDHKARMELQKKNPNFRLIREGFLEGHVHPDDIEPMVELLRHFYWISYLSEAIDRWTQGDTLLLKLETAGFSYRSAILKDDKVKANQVLNEIKFINESLTPLENDFSYVLGQGSRWLEYMVLSLLTLAVLTVESIGLSLAFFTSRSISRGLNELYEAAHRIGLGDFGKTVKIQSRDEIGSLGEAVNTMGSLLQKSYGELESRVDERTAELAKLASENAKLYAEAKIAVQTRDEFLSIASHELKTPLTSLQLQLQLQLHLLKSDPQNIDLKKLATMTESSLRQGKRLNLLIDELLDLTRLRVGQFQIHKEECDIVPTVRDAVTQLSADAARVGSVVSLHAKAPVAGQFDVTRVSQVVTNLISNAIKYGTGKPIEVRVQNDELGKIVIQVQDNGSGIAKEQQAKVFERFERGGADPNISGLGLGLYISQQIVEAHHGKISVESSPGKGSTFTVQL